MRPCWVCCTVRSPPSWRSRTVHRSPFLTQSVAEVRSLRSLVRVMISSPMLASLPSARRRAGPTLGRGVGALESVGAGLLVELADQLAGGGEHDRVQPRGTVGLPGREHVLGHGGQVADVHPVAVEVEAQGLGLALAQRQRGGAFGRVGEPDELGQLQRAVGGADVAQHAAGADRGELLVVADQADAAAALEDVLHGDVQGERVGHAGLVDHHERLGADAGDPVGQLAPVTDSGSG